MPPAYPGTNAIMPCVPVTQCAAVTSRSPCGLCTTLAVQKCVPSWPLLVVNSAPTADGPPDGVPVRAGDDASPTILAMRAVRTPVPPSAGVAKMMASVASTEVLMKRADGLASHRNQRDPRGRPEGSGSFAPSVSPLCGRMASLSGRLSHYLWSPMARY